MKFPEVLVCMGLALLAMTSAGVVPEKAGLSLKDKLALDIPVKQLITDKTGEKSQTVKVAFPTTTTPETTTATTTAASKQQRPKYVDAAIFRHQFTTPATDSTSFPTVDDEPVAVLFRGNFPLPEDSSTGAKALTPDTFDYESHFRLMDDLSSFDGELGIFGDDRRAEGYISSFRPLGF